MRTDDQSRCGFLPSNEPAGGCGQLLHVYSSPLGLIAAHGDGASVCRLRFLDEPCSPDGEQMGECPGFTALDCWLDAYFAGEDPGAPPPLRPEGTEFQKKVWALVRQIPWGGTVTYGQLARRLGRPGAAQAVGRAVGRNPLLLLIPCHRVVGSGGALTGYAGGLGRKSALLALERRE